jgi:protein-tyrosine phosphatase
MIDLHCHILPNIDDGPAALAESLQMAERAVANGIRVVVATPHADNGVYNAGPEYISERVAAFTAELRQASIPLEVYPGAEVQLFHGLADWLQQKRVATINSSRYILLELPPTLLPHHCRNELVNLLGHGFIPLLAHPERHPFLQRNPAYLAGLVKQGVLCQVTAQSLLGVFGRNVRAAAEHMLQNRLVHVLASDAHGPNGRVPALEEAVAAAARLLDSNERAEEMVSAIPAAIIADRDVQVELPETGTANTKKTAWPENTGSFFSSISGLWS